MTEITAQTKLLAVIGHPISHSLSPQIHNGFAAALELPYAYLAFDIEPTQLMAFIEASRLLGMAGFNVTMPHKEAILPHLDILAASAQRYGAVNTVAVRDGKLCGYNTDGDGFLMSLKNAGLAPQQQGALILGAGGAARAVALALAQEGAAVHMVSRRADRLPPLHPAVRYCSWQALSREAANCSLLVNATPLGMAGTKEDFADLSFLDTLPANAVVYDLIYRPQQTKLLKAAHSLGLKTMNGLAHLYCQAALSFAIFSGQTPPLDLIRKGIGDDDRS